MDLTLSMRADDLDPEDLQQLSLDLCRSLIDGAGVDAAPIEAAADGGTRGDPITLGALAITFLTSGTAVALLNVLKSYFDRSAAVSVELARADGAKLTLKADSLRSGQFQQTLAMAHRFLEAPGP
jgi:hypothetical protein